MTEIVSNTLDHFTANRASLLAAESPDAIHQVRVALRRLRSALVMFSWVLPSGELDDLRREAKRIASALGPARERDVLSACMGEMPVRREDCPVDCKALLAALNDSRIAAYKQARAAIESSDATVFIRKVQNFRELRAWRKGLSKAERRRLNGAATKFAKRALVKLNARVLKCGKGFPELSSQERHKLRIALKNLRYGTDFFGALFGHARQKQSYINRVSVLQELLGARQDAVNTMKIVGQLSAVSGPGSDKAAGFIIGWLSRSSTLAEKGVCKAWKKFKKADLRWCKRKS
jgi:triphosphatase